MLPGFGGGVDQPLLVALERALGSRGVGATRAALTRGRPSPGLAREVAEARACVDGDPEISAYAGRSFGGRVLLGFPVRSASGQRRLEDERVLEMLTCPTLVVQGAADPLGPVRTLERLAGRNARLELTVLPGATHSFGRREREAVETAADWLAARVHGSSR